MKSKNLLLRLDHWSQEMHVNTELCLQYFSPLFFYTITGDYSFTLLLQISYGGPGWARVQSIRTLLYTVLSTSAAPEGQCDWVIFLIFSGHAQPVIALNLQKEHFNVPAIPRQKEPIYGLLFKSFIVFKMWTALYKRNDQYCK